MNYKARFIDILSCNTIIAKKCLGKSNSNVNIVIRGVDGACKDPWLKEWMYLCFEAYGNKMIISDPRNFGKKNYYEAEVLLDNNINLSSLMISAGHARRGNAYR